MGLGEEQYASEKITIKYAIKGNERETIRSSLTLFDPTIGVELKIHFRILSESFKKLTFNDKITINNVNTNEFIDEFDLFINNNFFDYPVYGQNTLRRDASWVNARPRIVLVKAITSIFQLELEGNFDRELLETEADRLLNYKILNDNNIYNLVNTCSSDFKGFYQKFIHDKNNSAYIKLNYICNVNFYLEIFGRISRSLKDYFSAVEYIGPARVRSERFYRTQELEVTNISPDGRNLPIFLASLSKTKLQSFSDWVERRFGYGVTINKTEAHISINLQQDGSKVNIIDTGYGVSQVLPVLAQLWWMRENSGDDNKNSQPILAIEQPELHLHPAHQALLGEAFADAISDSTVDGSAIKLVVETHSEALINKLGELISLNKLSPNKVQIVVFGKNNLGDEEISLSSFDEEGILLNWPHGFFNYS